ncbi:hypothetical protein [Pseudomonas fluorescens group sp. PF-69]
MIALGAGKVRALIKNREPHELCDLYGIFAPTKVQGMSADIVKPPQFVDLKGF